VMVRLESEALVFVNNLQQDLWNICPIEWHNDITILCDLAREALEKRKRKLRNCEYYDSRRRMDRITRDGRIGGNDYDRCCCIFKSKESEVE
jgi:hypothetical protein